MSCPLIKHYTFTLHLKIYVIIIFLSILKLNRIMKKDFFYII